MGVDRHDSRSSANATRSRTVRGVAGLSNMIKAGGGGPIPLGPGLHSKGSYRVQCKHNEFRRKGDEGRGVAN
jgi:hypothetical protein